MEIVNRGKEPKLTKLRTVGELAITI